MSEPVGIPIWANRAGVWCLRLRDNAPFILTVRNLAGSLWQVDCEALGCRRNVSAWSTAEAKAHALMWLRRWLDDAKADASGKIEEEDTTQGGSPKEPV